MKTGSLNYTLSDIRDATSEMYSYIDQSRDALSGVDDVLRAFKSDLDDLSDNFWILVDQFTRTRELLDKYEDEIKEMSSFDIKSPDEMSVVIGRMQSLAKRVVSSKQLSQSAERALLKEVTQTLELDDDKRSFLHSDYKKAESVLTAMSMRYNEIYNKNHIFRLSKKSLDDIFRKISTADDFLVEVKYAIENDDVSHYVGAKINLHRCKTILREISLSFQNMNMDSGKKPLSLGV